MLKYVEVSPSDVIDEIKAGTEVNMLDKKEAWFDVMNYLRMETVLEKLADKSGRYYFWIVEYEDDTEESQLK